MKHDPLCSWPMICNCNIIRRVREDEKRYRNEVEWKYQQAAEAAQTAYDEGYKDAEKYYTNSCFFCGYAGEWSTWICEECEERMRQEAKEWESE